MSAKREIEEEKAATGPDVAAVLGEGEIVKNEELLGKVFTIKSVEDMEGNFGLYCRATVEVDGETKIWNTGGVVVIKQLHNLAANNYLPIRATLTQQRSAAGRRYFMLKAPKAKGSE